MSAHGQSAGASADERFAEGLASWRRANRPLTAALAAVAAGAGVGTYELTGSPWPVALGIVCGCASTLLAWLRDTPPEYVERWRRGAEGERRTAKRLARLRRAGWHVVHDVQARRGGNIDHVVVGPGGCYVIDTKRRTGVTSVRHDGALVVSRRHDRGARHVDEHVAGAARGQAAEVSRRVADACGRRVWVHPVVVLWCEFPQGVVEIGGVTWVSGARLRDWLASRPPRWSHEEVAALAALTRPALAR